MSGRGGLANKHPGNRVFRRLVQENKSLYHELSNSKRKQNMLVQSIMHACRSSGMRFLKQEKDSGAWKELDESEAWNKTSQALREKGKICNSECSERPSDRDFSNSSPLEDPLESVDVSLPVLMQITSEGPFFANRRSNDESDDEGESAHSSSSSLQKVCSWNLNCEEGMDKVQSVMATFPRHQEHAPLTMGVGMVADSCPVDQEESRAVLPSLFRSLSVSKPQGDGLAVTAFTAAPTEPQQLGNSSKRKADPHADSLMPSFLRRLFSHGQAGGDFESQATSSVVPPPPALQWQSSSWFVAPFAKKTKTLDPPSLFRHLSVDIPGSNDVKAVESSALSTTAASYPRPLNERSVTGQLLQQMSVEKDFAGLDRVSSLAPTELHDRISLFSIINFEEWRLGKKSATTDMTPPPTEELTSMTSSAFFSKSLDDMLSEEEREFGLDLEKVMSV